MYNCYRCGWTGIEAAPAEPTTPEAVLVFGGGGGVQPTCPDCGGLVWAEADDDAWPDEEETVDDGEVSG